MPASQKQRRITIETWNGDIQNLPCIGNGISGLVFEIDVRRVAKVALGTARSIEDIERERKIYRRFKQMLPNPDCHYILSCLESDNPRGLVFERCKGMVRSRLRSPSPILPEAVMKWAIQAAKGLGFVHDCGIIQGDVGCHNMLLDAKDTLKVADFAGSSIDGSDASVNYEVRSRLPGISRPTEKSDIFAFGSALYELATRRAPYSEESYENVQKLYRQEKFADVSMLPDLGPIITKCWRRQYATAWDVVEALERVNSHKLKHKVLQHNVMTPGNPAAPASDATDISQLEITHSAARRDRKASTTYIPRSSQRCPSIQGENEVDRKTRQRGQKERRSEYSWKYKFMPWLQPMQKGHEKDYHCL